MKFNSFDMQVPPFESVSTNTWRLGNASLLIYGRAARHLHDVAATDVEKALSALQSLFDDWTIERYGRSTTLSPPKEAVVLPFSGPSKFEWVLFTDAIQLLHRSNDAALQEYFGDLDIHWSALFASLSLGYQSAASAARNKAFQSETVAEAMEFADQSAALMTLAMEASTLADRVGGIDPFIQKKLDHLASQRSAKAGRARHDKTRKLKERFVAFHASRSWRSKAESARAFLKALSSQDRQLLSAENAVRTLIESLRQL